MSDSSDSELNSGRKVTSKRSRVSAHRKSSSAKKKKAEEVDDDPIATMLREKKARERKLAKIRAAEDSKDMQLKEELDRNLEAFAPGASSKTGKTADKVDKKLGKVFEQKDFLPMAMAGFFASKEATSSWLVDHGLPELEEVGTHEQWTKFSVMVKEVPMEIPALLERRVVPRICQKDRLVCPSKICLWLVRCLFERREVELQKHALLNLVDILLSQVRSSEGLEASTSFVAWLRKLMTKRAPGNRKFTDFNPTCDFLSKLLECAGFQEKGTFVSVGSPDTNPTLLGKGESTMHGLNYLLWFFELCAEAEVIQYENEATGVSALENLLSMLCCISIDPVAIAKTSTPYKGAGVLATLLENIPDSIWSREGFLDNVIANVVDRLKKASPNVLIQHEQAQPAEREIEEAIEIVAALANISSKLKPTEPRWASFKQRICLYAIYKLDVAMTISLFKVIRKQTDESKLQEAPLTIEEIENPKEGDTALHCGSILCAALGQFARMKLAKHKKSSNYKAVDYRIANVTLKLSWELLQIGEIANNLARKNTIYSNLDTFYKSLPKMSNHTTSLSIVFEQVDILMDRYKRFMANKRILTREERQSKQQKKLDMFVKKDTEQSVTQNDHQS